MTMTGYWDDLFAMERRIDEFMRSFLGTRTVFGRKAFVPPIDIYERKGDLVVRMEAPGLDPAKDIKVTVQEGLLVISGERQFKEEVEEKDFYRMETSYGTFTRSVPLPEGFDEDTIKAEYKDGVLEVVAPQAAKALEAPKPKEIPVRAPKAIKAA
ncbi:MAG TPA: Hsp20/alpha crystallin family protein [Actinomycetota bacterium]|jgi:HSP20 family protein